MRASGGASPSADSLSADAHGIGQSRSCSGALPRRSLQRPETALTAADVSARHFLSAISMAGHAVDPIRRDPNLRRPGRKPAAAGSGARHRSGLRGESPAAIHPLSSGRCGRKPAGRILKRHRLETIIVGTGSSALFGGHFLFAFLIGLVTVRLDRRGRHQLVPFRQRDQFHALRIAADGAHIAYRNPDHLSLLGN